MYVESVPNRNSPPAVLLRESSRLDGKIVKRGRGWHATDESPPPQDTARK